MFSWLNRVYTEGEPAPVVPPPPTEIVFDAAQQAKVNELLAKEKRDFQKKLDEAVKRGGNTAELQAKLKELNDSLQTKEQLAAQEAATMKETYESQLKAKTESEEAWANRFKTTVFDVQLTNAAVKHDAFDPKQLGTLLVGSSKVVESTDKEGKGTGEFKVMTSITIGDKTLVLPIEEAVGKLRDAGQFPNQFKVKGSPGTGITLNNGGNGGGSGDGPPTDVNDFMKWVAQQGTIGLMPR